MTRNLLYKTSRAYVIFSALLLLLAAPLFYFSTKKLYNDDTDDTLLLHKKEFLKYTLPAFKQRDIGTWNRYNRNIKIVPLRNHAVDSLFNNSYFDALDNEIEPYRELTTPIAIDGKEYSYAAKISLVETEDLVTRIALLFLIILSLLLLGLYAITKRLSKKLWRPFNAILIQIENFEIDKSVPTASISSNITEFSRLNTSVQKLIAKNRSIFKAQREFVENAAHELQTPLAIFQAKLDSFVQTGDFTIEQYEQLSSINDTITRLSRLNKNLLLLSKMENEIYASTTLIIIEKTITQNILFFKEQADSKNITIELDLSQAATVIANPTLMEIMISNLYLNAIKHNIHSGKITIMANKNGFSFSNTADKEPLNNTKLFNRFSKQSSVEQGNGLGLAIIKKICDLNGWTVRYAYENSWHHFTVLF